MRQNHIQKARRPERTSHHSRALHPRRVPGGREGAPRTARLFFCRHVRLLVEANGGFFRRVPSGAATLRILFLRIRPYFQYFKKATTDRILSIPEFLWRFYQPFPCPGVSAVCALRTSSAALFASPAQVRRQEEQKRRRARTRQLRQARMWHCAVHVARSTTPGHGARMTHTRGRCRAGHGPVTGRDRASSPRTPKAPLAKGAGAFAVRLSSGSAPAVRGDLAAEKVLELPSLLEPRGEEVVVAVCVLDDHDRRRRQRRRHG